MEKDEQMKLMAAQIGRMQIEALATSAGAIDPDKVYAAVWNNAKADIDEKGIVKLAMVNPETGEALRTVSGEDMSVGQFIQTLKESPDTGFLFEDGAASKTSVKTNGLTTETNPFLYGEHWNLTEQGRLLKSDPVFAARLRDAANNLQDTTNPFSKPGFNLTKQSELLRRDPAMADKLRKQAAGEAGTDNPWISNNLTLQVLTIRSNPDKAAKQKAEAKAFKAANGTDKPKSLIFTLPPGSFKRMGTGR